MPSSICSLITSTTYLLTLTFTNLAFSKTIVEFNDRSSRKNEAQIEKVAAQKNRGPASVESEKELSLDDEPNTEKPE